jgi:S-adenosylmethionine-dependent methyltransferase
VADEHRRTGRATTSLRTHAVWATVGGLAGRRQDELGRPLRVLDLGGGTGGMAVPLAGLGHHVTVVDPSPDALAALERRAAEAGVAERISAVQGDADTLADVLPDRDTDLVCCHGVLEVVDDPEATLHAVAESLADDGHLSLLVAGRLAVVLAKALAGDFPAARTALDSDDGRWGPADPLPRRFDLDQLEALLSAAGFVGQESHGVRVLSDLVPSGLVDSETDRTALLDLEQAISEHPHYAFLGALGAGLHVLARLA